MPTPALKHRLRQAAAFAGAVASASPLGKILFVDSVNGADGNPGLDELHPLLTLTQAVSLADAGDTIVCNPGGSETVTAAIAVAVADLKILCPALNPRSGFTIEGAGTLDLLSVTAAGCHVEGMRFAHTGATSSAAGILTSNAADRLTVVRCLFDDSAIVTTFTGFGVEVTNACDDVVIKDCEFVDCHRGVLFIMATGTVCARPRVRGCTFMVGRATAYGLCSALTGTGAVRGLVVSGCEFVEANGDGAAATDAWDGTNGANGLSGPVFFEAAVDQFLVADCRAYGLSNASFDNLVNNAGAGDFVECSTAATVSGDIDSVYSDTTIIVSDTTAIHTQTTAIDSDMTIVKSDTTAIHLQTTTATSDLVQVYSDTTIAVSDTTAIHSDTTIIASDVVVLDTRTTTIASDLVIVASDAVRIESDTTVIESDTTAIHLQTTAIDSDITIIKSDTTAVHLQTTTIASDLVLMQAGYPVAKLGVNADIAGIPNNSQAAGGLLATATGGDVIIDEIIIAKDTTALTGPTNIRLSTDNVYGDTGVGDPVAAIAVAAVVASTRIAALGTVVWTTLKLPFVLESTKGLWIDGDDSAGTSGGNYKYAIRGRAQNSSTTLA